MDERIESLRILFREAVNRVGFTDKEISRLLGRKRIDSPSALGSATNQDIAITLVHLCAIFHTWTASVDEVRAFVRTERFALPDEFAGQSATIAEAFLSRDLIKFEDAPKWADQRFLAWSTERRSSAGIPANGSLH